MGKQELSIPSLANQIATEADAYLLLERLRWDGHPVCPHCGVIDGHYYLKPRDGVSRTTRTGAVTQRRVWKCHKCRKQFSVLTGTIFHGSKIPLRTWLFVIFEMCASKNGVSAREIERKYDLTAKSAWFMLHRIREAMKRDPLAGLLSGAIQADETWVGGDPKNRHRSDPREQTRVPGQSDKVAVFSLVHYESREVRSRVVPDVTGRTLLPAMNEQAKLSSVWLQSDGGAAYKTIARHVADHQFVDHTDGQYVGPGQVGTNLVEGYFSQLKRSIDGTHHHVSKVHLERYLAQFDFMYSHCRRTDTQRMGMLVERTAGRRLSYKPLKAK